MSMPSRNSPRTVVFPLNEKRDRTKAESEARRIVMTSVNAVMTAELRNPLPMCPISHALEKLDQSHASGKANGRTKNSVVDLKALMTSQNSGYSVSRQ